jgi:hypothetical protein
MSEGRLAELQQAYNKTFASEEGQKVLKDLEKICFAKFTTIHELPHMTCYNEGQRAVFLHIKTRMEMNLKKEIPNG